MLVFLLKRLASSIPTLFIVMTLTFFVMRVVPGGPFDTEKALPPEVKANIERRFGLDQPLPIQYFNYVKNALKGDLGPSYRFMGGRDVSEIIRASLPVSLELGFYALLFAVIVGIPLGVLAAYFRNSWIDFSSMILAVAGMSLPSYLVAAVLVMVFSLWLDWLPAALWEGPATRILPAVTLGLRPMALVARLVRASAIEALSSDYVRTAYAKGLSVRTVLFKHALANSLIPVITMMGPMAAAVLTGSFVVEVMFAIPGLGKYFVTAVIDRDYTVIMGVTLVYGVILIVCNIAVDVLYGVVDPRMREGGRA